MCRPNDAQEVRLGNGVTVWRRRGTEARADDGWKQQVLMDFEQWLEALPEGLHDAKEGDPTQACDLHTLFSAFASLRQEVRLQNREQAKAARGLERAAEAGEAAAALFRSRSEDLGGLEARIRATSEHRCVLPFLDVRDALVRGREAAARLAQRQGLLRRPPRGVEGIVQGYEMAIERFDRALSLLGVTRVPTVGRRFDPRMMVALEVRTAEDEEDEVVVVELLSGYCRGDEVLRLAQVVVNRRKVSNG